MQLIIIRIFILYYSIECYNMVQVMKPPAWVLSIDPSGHFDIHKLMFINQTLIILLSKVPPWWFSRTLFQAVLKNKTKEPHSSRNYNMLLYVLSFYLYYLAWRQVIIFSCVRIEIAFGRLTTNWSLVPLAIE